MFDLREYKKRPDRLADYLPWAALVAPGIILNKDGSFQRIIRYRGPDLESSTQQELVSVCARINDILKRFGSGWSLFFEAARNRATGYPTSQWPDAVSWLVDQERKAAFESEGSHFETTFYLTLCWLPPEDKVSRIEEMFLEKAKDESQKNEMDYLGNFMTETDRAIDLLGTLFPEISPLCDEEMLSYLHATISVKRHRITPPEVSPEVPMYLDSLLPDSDLTGGLSPKLGDHHLKILTIMGFPGETTPGILDGLNNLGLEYRWTVRFLPMNKSAATSAITKYRRLWFSKRKSIAAILKEVVTNEQSVLMDSDADNKAADADEALQELGADHVAYGYFTATVVVWDKTAENALAKLRAVERVINGAGFVTIRETVNAVDAWLGSLPGHCYANVRQPLISTLNLAHMMPLSSVWAGPSRNDHLDGPPLLMAETSGATPFRLVTHMGDVGHTLIVGPTGAGKSVLLSLLALQFRRYKGAQVFIFDKGGSARIATLGMGGHWYNLGAEIDSRGEEAMAFQPLARIDKDSELTWAMEWVSALLCHENITITPDVKDRLWSALVNLSKTPVRERTLTGLSALLQGNSLKQALIPYTLNGPHGYLLDADHDGFELGHMMCFEMEQLMHNRSVTLPVLTYLFHRLESNFDGRPTLLILDEAWVFLDDPTFSGRIREWLKVLRKKNVSVIFATQSLSDIAESTIAPAIIESCPSRLFLPNPRALEPQQQKIYQNFGLNERQIEIIANATPKRDYYFSCRQGNRLFDLALGPVALAFTAAITSGPSNPPNGSHFAVRYLQERNLSWAAELVQQFSNRKDG